VAIDWDNGWVLRAIGAPLANALGFVLRDREKAADHPANEPRLEKEPP
jgi:hypothetical protein